MYHLVAGLYAQLNRRDATNALVIGPSGAGKTTLLERISAENQPRRSSAVASSSSHVPAHVGGRSSMRGRSKTPSIDARKIKPTVGQNVLHLPLRHSRVDVHFWDLGGDVRLRALWREYYAEAQLLVLVVDGRDWVRADSSDRRQRRRRRGEDGARRSSSSPDASGRAAYAPNGHHGGGGGGHESFDDEDEVERDVRWALTGGKGKGKQRQLSLSQGEKRRDASSGAASARPHEGPQQWFGEGGMASRANRRRDAWLSLAQAVDSVMDDVPVLIVVNRLDEAARVARRLRRRDDADDDEYDGGGSASSRSSSSSSEDWGFTDEEDDERGKGEEGDAAERAASGVGRAWHQTLADARLFFRSRIERMCEAQEAHDGPGRGPSGGRQGRDSGRADGDDDDGGGDEGSGEASAPLANGVDGGGRGSRSRGYASPRWDDVDIVGISALYGDDIDAVLQWLRSRALGAHSRIAAP